MATIGDSVRDLREDIPLKSGIRNSKLCDCSEECLGGSKFINCAFGSLTLIITVALLVQIYYGDYQVVPHGSVASDSLQCSEIGTNILKQGGNSVDAAIATTFCLAVVIPHITGLEAEGEILIYNHRTRINPVVINFSGNNSVSDQLPRLVLGLAYTHQQYGSISWKRLVEPAVNIARKGFLVSRMLVAAIKNAKAEDIYGHLEPGQILQLENLSGTLQIIANTPEEELYKYITHDNHPTFMQALKASFLNYDLYLPSYPTAGPVLSLNLQHIQSLNFTRADSSKPEYIYRLGEITQVVYSELNISSKFHVGTATNVAAMDMSDNYVAVVTGMYAPFGSHEMSPAGYLVDVKDRYLKCSRLPIIVIDGQYVCGRRMVFGASDVAEATQLIASLIIEGNNASTAIEAPRFQVTLNGTVGIEWSRQPSFKNETLKYLEALSPLYDVKEPYPSSNIVEKTADELSSHSDSRGGGIASRF